MLPYRTASGAALCSYPRFELRLPSAGPLTGRLSAAYITPSFSDESGGQGGASPDAFPRFTHYRLGDPVGQFSRLFARAAHSPH
jgi:hypothetical protein